MTPNSQGIKNDGRNAVLREFPQRSYQSWAVFCAIRAALLFIGVSRHKIGSEARFGLGRLHFFHPILIGWIDRLTIAGRGHTNKNKTGSKGAGLATRTLAAVNERFQYGIDACLPAAALALEILDDFRVEPHCH